MDLNSFWTTAWLSFAMWLLPMPCGCRGGGGLKCAPIGPKRAKKKVCSDYLFENSFNVIGSRNNSDHSHVSSHFDVADSDHLWIYSPVSWHLHLGKCLVFDYFTRYRYLSLFVSGFFFYRRAQLIKGYLQQSWTELPSVVSCITATMSFEVFCTHRNHV